MAAMGVKGLITCQDYIQHRVLGGQILLLLLRCVNSCAVTNATCYQYTSCRANCRLRLKTV